MFSIIIPAFNLTLEQASSIRSIALSGRNLSGRYLCDIVTAAFIAASVIRTFLPIPAEITHFLSQDGKFVIVMAMTAIGLNTNIVKLIKNGLKPRLLGFLCWTAIAVVSLAVQYGFGL